MAALLYTLTEIEAGRGPDRADKAGDQRIRAGQQDGSRPGAEHEPYSEICEATPRSGPGPSGRRPTRTGHLA